MTRIGDVVAPPEKEGKEKHVPHIEAPSRVKAGESFEVTVTVGKETPHPNKLEHHIKYVNLYAKEEGDRPAVTVGKADFGPTFAEPKVTFNVMLQKTSELIAVEYCNIHGLWDNSVKVEVE